MFQPAEFSTTLSAAAASGATSITVASATGLPTLGTGDITVVRLDDGAGGAENALCTAISGTTLTVAALAGAHASGATVKGAVVNIAALTQIRKDALAMGPEVAITAAATATLGRMHRCNPTAADMTLTLPSGTVEGDMIAVRIGQAATKFVTLSFAGNIDGQTTRLMWKGESAYLRWDSVNSAWTKTAGKSIAMVGSLVLTGTPTIAHNTVTTIPLSVSAIDNTGVMVEGPVFSRIRIQRAGIYGLKAEVGIANSSAACPRIVGILQANAVSISANENASFAAATNPCVSIGIDTTLAVNDLLTLQMYQNSGTTQTFSVGGGAPVTGMSAVEILGW